MMSVNLIALSHGHMAKETVNASEMIVGRQDSIHALTFSENESVDELRAKVENCLVEFNHNPCILIVDLFGGTPFNVAVQLSTKYPQLRILSGLNLAMIIEYSVTKHMPIDDLTTYLERIGKESVVCVALNGIEEDEIDF